jgi:FkbM family methyltransferase
MLKAIRKIKIINLFFRVIFKALRRRSTAFFDFMIARWPTSGVIDCTFEGYKFKMYNECDDPLVNIFYYSNVKYEEENDLKLFTGLSGHSKTIIDIGANTGIFSVLAGLANHTADIYAIEPYSPNYSRLNINLKLNSCSNVKTLQLAMGESSGTVGFTVPESNAITDVSSVNGEFSKSIYPELKWKKEIVGLDTPDNIKAANKIAKIDLIKCDVETYEMSVFRGMDHILRVDRPVIIFECFLDPERQVFFNDILKKYDYYVYNILTEGIVHLNNGFEKTSGGLNYLLSPMPPQSNYVNYKYLAQHPEVLFAQSN